ncbi:MAG: hypothetical protein LBP65_02510 [Puniceicoccales bacterium]|jgi:hypothetical protein|nr:hypothetical protein [Puniceicoccales bacterium]
MGSFSEKFDRESSKKKENFVHHPPRKKNFWPYFSFLWKADRLPSSGMAREAVSQKRLKFLAQE